MRLLLALVLAGVLALLPAAGTASPARARTRDALAVLHRWDERRADAWADASPAALRSLYVPGSTAAGADVRLLRRYTRHGLVVRRLRTQVFSATVLRRSPGLVRLRVLDRVAGGEVYDGSRAVPLPASPPALRVVELHHGDGRWRVASVRRVRLSGSGPAPPRAPPGRPGRGR